MAVSIVLLHDVEGPRSAGLDRLASLLADRGLRTLRPTSVGGWWRGDALTEWAEAEGHVSATNPGVVVGVGSGGQAAFRSAYGASTRWGVVAAIAPASDLGRWHGQGTELDGVYENADRARQDEAALHFNPLARPMAQLCWCDPRDDACLPSALRLVSKSQSSGVEIAADLETEIGASRDEYLLRRADELAAWIVDGVERIRLRPDLPVVSR